MTSNSQPRLFRGRWPYIALTLAVAVVAASVAALLTDIAQKKAEQRNPYVRVVEVGENDTDPAKWGRNWPMQYDGYRRTNLLTKTKYGGHGGSEGMPEEKIERDPWLKRMFLGYAFSIDYRDRRGHAYMLTDQEATKRLTKPQSGSCLHCHASIMPLYRELGNGDAIAGFEKTFTFSYQDLSKKLHESGHAHPVSCVDCHDPSNMALRVTRPGFIQGIQRLADSNAPVPALPRSRPGVKASASIRTTRTSTRRATSSARSYVASVTSSTTARRRSSSRSRGAKASRSKTSKRFGTRRSSRKANSSTTTRTKRPTLTS